MPKPLVMLLALLSLCAILVSCGEGDKPEEVQPPTTKEIEETVSAMEEYRDTHTESEFYSEMDKIVSEAASEQDAYYSSVLEYNSGDFPLFDPHDYDDTFESPIPSDAWETAGDPMDGYEDGEWLESPSFSD